MIIIVIKSVCIIHKYVLCFLFLSFLKSRFIRAHRQNEYSTNISYFIRMNSIFIQNRMQIWAALIWNQTVACFLIGHFFLFNVSNFLLSRDYFVCQFIEFAYLFFCFVRYFSVPLNHLWTSFHSSSRNEYICFYFIFFCLFLCFLLPHVFEMSKSQNKKKTKRV